MEAATNTRSGNNPLAGALTGTGVIVAQVDRDLRYTWIFNPHPDCRPEEAIGKRDDELADNDGTRQLTALKQRVLQTGRPARADIGFTLSDDVRTYEVVGRPIIEAGEVAGVVTVAADVSSMKRALDAEQLFVQAVVHDLRHPLAAIYGFAQQLARQGAGSEQVREILAASLRMQAMLNDLQDMSAIDAQQVELVCEPFDLADAVRAAVHRSSGEATHRFRIDAPPEPVVGHWDRSYVERVLDNLVGNAIKYSPRDAEVLVTVEHRGEEARVVVVDEGIGLSPEELANLFTRGARSERARASGVRGFGLGLFIAKAFIEAHGGRLWAESAGEGKGSTFTFTLPL